MAASAVPATPQRLPGVFPNTPAPAPTIFASQAATLRSNQPPPAPVAAQTVQDGQNQHETDSVARAATTITNTLIGEDRFPDLESYVHQGATSDYEWSQKPSWEPFQKLKLYELPPRILEQANRTEVGMEMGVFPALGHAWVALDNCLYMWDYTIPNPDLIGFEDNPHPILQVRLVKPRPGVFVKEIQHLIVVSTSAEMLLLGVSTPTTVTGASSIALYNTRMSIQTRGLAVDVIESSPATGRIFFAGQTSDDIYEFYYQQEEGWFRGKTTRLCHTRGNYAFFPDTRKAVTSWVVPQQPRTRLKQIAVDDSRSLLYTLSYNSEINIYAMKDGRLDHALKRVLSGLLQSTGHFTSRSELLHTPNAKIVSLSAVPKAEASKLSILATTDTGCRLYISVTQGYGNPADASNPPSGAQILHIRFPPPSPDTATTTTFNQLVPQTAFAVQAPGANTHVANNSHVLDPTLLSYRFSPGYFLAFLQQPTVGGKMKVFCAAPDSARLKNPHDPAQLSSRFYEFGQWLELPPGLQQVQLVTEAFQASNVPLGFGNELAVQYDKPSTEIAIMTSAGVQLIRRRRLVDVFAAMVRSASSDEESFDADIKRFIRTYGRSETVATALAVACGQGVDVAADGRVAAVLDAEVTERSRKVYIDQGGKAEYNSNAVDSNSSADHVRPSPRHEGTALYISRLVRSIWRQNIIREEAVPGAPAIMAPAVQLGKLRSVQRQLSILSDFLERNKSFIEGLAGPNPLARTGTRQEELALAGEHRAMISLQKLIARVVEGISFVLVLFDENVVEILSTVSPESQKTARSLTFEGLFVDHAGRELAKELVKAIVNRNIANGSNVDTVAEALRRRCGSFCSADDVVIFKAQEQVKRASEASQGQSEAGRTLLNESQRLFQKVAGSLSQEYLQNAVRQYVSMSFYAGAIELCLVVAAERDKAKHAQAWLREGCPPESLKEAAHQKRKQCYDLIFDIITELDRATESAPESLDGHFTLATRRRNEAYEVINSSDDTVFLTCLYDWYLSQGKEDRLLAVDQPFVVEYLQQQSDLSRPHADLLWRYFAHYHDYLRAAAVQLSLARAENKLSLEERIGYLSRARSNACTRQSAFADSRQSKQQLLREISDLLDLANIQDDILQRMKDDSRLTAERRPHVLARLDGPILPIEELFNQFADQAEYYDICLLIYQVADHRNPADIRLSWEKLIEYTDTEAVARNAIPWESIGTKVVQMGRRLNASDTVFPIQLLVSLLEKYSVGAREYHPPANWPVDVLIKEPLEVPHETVLPALEQLYYGNEAPFNTKSKRRILAGQIVYLLKQWVLASERRGERIICGSEENASITQDCLASLIRGGDLEDPAVRREAEDLIQVFAAQGFGTSARRRR